jgi:hypothetical protein
VNNLITRIQNWYKINCNGDWEHSYGYKIENLDNPGWTVRIDLNETSLEKLQFKREFQNPTDENDWYQIHTKESKLKINCGPENLNQTFEVFFDEIIPKHSDTEFKYEVYIPVIGKDFEIWTPAKAILINENTLQISEIDEIQYKEIKVRDVDVIDFNQSDLNNMELKCKVGDYVNVKLENVYDGTILSMNEIINADNKR